MKPESMRPPLAVVALCAASLWLVSCGKSGGESGGSPQGATAGSATASGGAGTASTASTSGAAGGPIEVVTKLGIAMISLPGGEFAMGSAQGSPDEAPVHRVKVSPFLMDKFEVTQDQYAKVQLPNPSHWQDNTKRPVERVRWRDAKQYCNERSLAEGLKPCYNEKTADWDCDDAASGYRLPTEAEWEYAARAGTDGAYDFGAADKLRQYGWFASNSDQRTHATGQKRPNAWGFYDLYGNVSEWCEDVYSETFYKEKESVAPDPKGPPGTGKDVRRVIRGGSWKSSAEVCRVSARQGEKTGDSDACFSTDYCGFRCVRRATAEEIATLRAAVK